MTLRTIDRVNRPPLARHQDDADRRIRFASHRTGDSQVLVIWIGPDLAKMIGLDCPRAAVDLLMDEDFTKTRLMGIRANRNGQFRAARRSQNVAIYLNCDSFEQYFGTACWFSHLADEDSITVSDGLLQFIAPTGTPRSRQVDLTNRTVTIHGAKICGPEVQVRK